MIIVDPTIKYPKARGIFKGGSCHMTSTTGPDELHEFAARIGLKRNWFQYRSGRGSHYDLVPSKRALAVALGAKEVGRREILYLGYNWSRHGQKPPTRQQMP